MKTTPLLASLAAAAAFATLVPAGRAQAAPASVPLKVLNTAQFPGTGPIDYVYADAVGRKAYVPRGTIIKVFDLDTLKSVGDIDSTNRARGVAVDPATHHGFCSSNPVVMFDTETLKIIKTIQVQGSPDGINFEPASGRVYILSHTSPNVTAIDPKDGSIVNAFDIGGAPEQSASDGKGLMYIDLEDQDAVAVVDVKTMKVVNTWGLGGKGGGPSGLGLDAKNGILFAFCATPATCVILNAADGKIITSLPIGTGTDGGGFNPKTMEAFSSQRDGTLTIIKENSPTDFVVEQTVKTKTGAKTCTLDSKTDHIVLICTEAMPATPAAATGAPATGATPPPAASTPGAPPASAAGPGPGRRGGARGNNGPAFLDLIVVGR